MRLASLFITAVLLFEPRVVAAGGTSYQVRIRTFAAGGQTKATFVVESTAEEIMPGCKVVQVVAQYRLWRWPWSREKTFTPEAHGQALRHLEEAYKSEAQARFGIMGMGLGHESSDGPCVFRSRALAVLEETGGTHAVYSLYKDP